MIATLQFLLAATFLVIPVVGYLHGADAQQAAEADLVRQGFPLSVFTQHRINFGATRGSVVLAVAIGLCFATVASLNLAGSDIGRTLSWIFQPLILIAGSLVMPGEVFTVRFVSSTFKDPALRDINVKAFVDAARGAYPRWFPYVAVARLVLATLGSVLVIILLATG